MAIQFLLIIRLYTGKITAVVSHIQTLHHLEIVQKRLYEFCERGKHGPTEESPCIKDSLWLFLIQEPSDFSIVLTSTTSEKLFIVY